MMEAVSGSVTAAGIYLKVAEGTNKEERDREKRDMEKERRPCNEREALAGESERHQFHMNQGPGVQGGKGGGGSRDN